MTKEGLKPVFKVIPSINDWERLNVDIHYDINPESETKSYFSFSFNKSM
jgi:hypothetical protein